MPNTRSKMSTPPSLEMDIDMLGDDIGVREVVNIP